MSTPDVPIVSEELPFTPNTNGWASIGDTTQNYTQLVDDSLIVTLHGAAQLPTGTRITIAVVIGGSAPPTDAPPTVEAPAVRKYMGDGAQSPSLRR